MSRFYLGVIVLLALVLRFSFLSSYPPSLNWDEVSHGYNAYSVLQTGKDEWGVSFPTIFRAYGDYKLPVYIYLTALSESIFGLNEFAVRFPSALAGVGTVVFTYLLVKQLFKDQKIALLGAFLVAIEPWSFFLSRVALEANVAVLLITSGVYFFLIAVNKKGNYLLLSALLLGLSVWTYNSARIFVPFLSVSLLFVYRDKLKKGLHKSILFVSAIILLLFFVPMFLQLIDTKGQARYENVRILDQGAIATIENSRNGSDLPDVIDKLIYNRPVYFATKFTQNYISHFLPNFLFFQGGSNFQFNVPNYGLLHVVSLPLYYVGILLTFKNLSKKEYKLLSFWLLLAPIASSVTREAPHTLRSIVFLPIPMIFVSLAAIKLLNKKYLVGYLILLAIFFGAYLQKYIQYNYEYSSSWQYGYKDAVSFIKDNYDKYQTVIISKKYGEAHEFLLFYMSWNPEDYRNDIKLNRFYQTNWYWVDGFDKFYFVNDWEIPQDGNAFITESNVQINCDTQSCLLVTSPNNKPNSWNKIKEVKFLNNETVFELYEN